MLELALASVLSCSDASDFWLATLQTKVLVSWNIYIYPDVLCMSLRVKAYRCSFSDFFRTIVIKISKPKSEPRAPISRNMVAGGPESELGDGDGEGEEGTSGELPLGLIHSSIS